MMNLATVLTSALTAMLLLYSATSAAQFNKCIRDGSVTYQNTPCPTTEKTRQPTVDELNAERKKRLDQKKTEGQNPKPQLIDERSVPHQQPPSDSIDAHSRGINKHAKKAGEPAARSFKCDGRNYCSQMTSCAEAIYFLANCPGVKMDGNHDGKPCEQQWCGR